MQPQPQPPGTAGDMRGMPGIRVVSAQLPTAVAPAAADPVSALLAAQVAAHAQAYAAITEQVAAVREILAKTLGDAAGWNSERDAPGTPPAT